MSPTQEDRARIAKLNDYLQAELGNPPYLWMFSEDLVFDELVDRVGSVWLPQAQRKRTKLCKSLEHQWVLCRFLPDGSTVYPCAHRTGYVAMDRGQIPDMNTCQEVCRIVRAERDVTKADDRQAIENAPLLRQKEVNSQIYDRVANAAPAFGGIPGRKLNWGLGGDGPSKEMKRA